jgi:hypothetical protein
MKRARIESPFSPSASGAQTAEWRSIFDAVATVATCGKR